ncbi:MULTISPECIES: glutamate--cysteine ligase [unclassified Brevibacterium]|uniref:glutamate--cysteine ligase n=1 Tax=unclassified Brevibacterium TaxID=2614124 RepID=UPI001E63E735|nr:MULTISPECIES: glutamate--cysteine ligase [unclassified Brevibacterium]MCD1285654.1 glutamate--cysteine ligase [Brevibacterium sp. CCUG 69071]MDK8434712.1 glutamate--cysteine ligase [Brevibacterium sp. H-BE7]
MVDFARSPRSTLGVEWELALLDGESLDLTPAAETLLADVAEHAPAFEKQIVGEMLTNTIELVTGVHTQVAGIAEDLAVSMGALRTLTEARGVELMSAGTHPFAQWQSQEVRAKDRYLELVDRTQWWGRNMLIFGVHVHVGIDSRDKVLPIIGALLAYVPHLQALSASSPFWGGTDTGYASNRAMMFQQLPTAGLPFQFEEWADYEKYVDDMLTTGIIDHINEIRWDIRPAPHWGTVEVRVCDGLPTLEEIVAITALIQCLVDDLSERLDAGETLPRMPDWFHDENKWRAARYGMDAIIIENAAADERLVTECLADEVERLTPVAERLGCLEELGSITTIVERGVAYQRLQKVFASTGSLTEVTRSLIRELRTSYT